MIKAKFASEQQPVKIIQDNNKLYVFVCLNGKYGTAEYNDGSKKYTEEYIEYDYNEFSANKSDIDIDDIKSNPKKYLSYPLPPITDMEQLRADVDYLLMLNE